MLYDMFLSYFGPRLGYEFARRGAERSGDRCGLGRDEKTGNLGSSAIFEPSLLEIYGPKILQVATETRARFFAVSLNIGSRGIIETRCATENTECNE